MPPRSGDHTLPAMSERESPLRMDAEQMRSIGYRTIDMLIRRLVDGDAAPMRAASDAELSALIDGEPPEHPLGFEQSLAELEANVLTYASRLAHPGYFAFIPASSTFAGALGDLIAGALDIDAGSWTSASGPSRLELIVLDWFRSWIGYPQGAEGVLVSGGSAANLTALACARETLVGPGSATAVAYASDQTHSSIGRALRTLGFAPDRVRTIPSDGCFRVRLDALRAAIDADARAGLRPLIVIANAGATNTGAIDPLPELADVCARHAMWLHVDAAYGGFVALSEHGRLALRGLELADSVTLDPHKWLHQPIECGCVLTRRPGLLTRAFATAPDYLEDYRSAEVDFCDRGLQLTRGARALKIWLSLNTFGVGAFRAAVDRALALARHVAHRIAADPELELLCPPELGVVCFRRVCAGCDQHELDLINADLVARLEATGHSLVSSTRLDGRYAIRMCIMNHTTSKRDVDRVLDWLREATLAVPSRPLVGSDSWYRRERAGRLPPALTIS